MVARTNRVLALVAGTLLAAPAAAAAAPAAELLIQHPSRNTVNASTYTAGTMRLLNAGTVAVTGLAIEFEPGAGILPDMVVDPDDGTPAGDEVAKGFTLDGGPAGLTASAQYLLPEAGGYRRMQVSLNGLAPGAMMPFSVDIDPTSIQGSPDNAPSGPVSGAEMAGARVTVTFADGAELSTRLTPVPNTGTTANGLVDARAVVPAPAPAPALARAAGPSPAVVSTPVQQVVVSGPPGASGVVVAAEARTALAHAPGGGFRVSPLEPNMLAVGKPPIPFTIGAGGTATVTVNLTRQTPPDAFTTTGLTTVVAYLQSAGAPGPMSAPLVMQPAEPGPGSISLVDPAGATPGTFARRTSGVTGLPEALPLTASAWVKAPATPNDQPIVQHGPQVNGDMRGWTLALRSDRRISFALNNDAPGRTRVFDPAVPADRWAFVAVTATADATTLETWNALDGWSADSESAIPSYVPTVPADPLSVGAAKGAPGYEYTGLIDDVRIWSVARTPAAIRGDHTTRLTGGEAGLASYHPFDEALGTSVADLAGTNTLFLNGAGGVFPFTATGGDWSPDTPMDDPSRAGAPALVSTYPAAGDAVPAGARLVVGFSEPMNPSSVAAAVTVSEAGVNAPVSVLAGAGGRIFTVVPSAPLTTGVPHVLTVAGTATDLSGVPLGTGGERAFGVVADPAVPADVPGSGPPEPPPAEPPVTPPVAPPVTPPVAPPVVPPTVPPVMVPPVVPPPAGVTPSAPLAAPPAVTPTRAATPVFCTRFAATRAKLAKQLRVAKRARARATTKRVRIVMTKRIKATIAKQRALVAKRKRICRRA